MTTCQLLRFRVENFSTFAIKTHEIASNSEALTNATEVGKLGVGK